MVKVKELIQQWNQLIIYIQLVEIEFMDKERRTLSIKAETYVTGTAILDLRLLRVFIGQRRVLIHYPR